MCSPVCGEMLEEGEEVSHDHEDGSRPGLDQLPHLDHELVLGLQLCHGQQISGRNVVCEKDDPRKSIKFMIL